MKKIIKNNYKILLILFNIIFFVSSCAYPESEGDENESLTYEIESEQNITVNLTFPSRVTDKIFESLNSSKLNIYYQNGTIYKFDLDLNKTENDFNINLENFPIIANHEFSFETEIKNSDLKNILRGELTAQITDLNNSINIQTNFTSDFDVSEFLPSIENININPNEDNSSEILLNFEILNPENDSNLSFLIEQNSSSLGTFSQLNGIITSSELNLTLTNEDFNTSFSHIITLTNSFNETVEKYFNIEINSTENSDNDESLNFTLNYAQITNQNSVDVEISEALPFSEIYVNNENTGYSIPPSRIFVLDLNLTNEGENNFSIQTAKNGKYGDEVNITIIRDTTAPNQDATLTYVSTDDLSPELTGNLPSTADIDDDNRSLYTITVEINGSTYNAINNQDGTWTLANDEISDLSEGNYDANITVSDELGNSSSTLITNAFQINYSAFLVNAQVEGLSYVSGSETGLTDSNGQLKYTEADNITLYLGNQNSGIELGTISASFIQNNSETNRKELDFLKLINSSNTQKTQKSLNLIRLLASLDADKDMSNGIQIDASTQQAFILANPTVNIESDESNFSQIADLNDIFNDLAPHFGEHRGLISNDDAESYVDSFISGEEITVSNIAVSSSIEKKEIEILSGTLRTVEGIVEGINYRSGMQHGITDSNGTFYYENGKKIRFSIGMMELGETVAKSLMTPVDMVESVSFEHPKPRNIVRLLTLLDAVSGDSKVTIDKMAKDTIEMFRSPIDLNLPDGQANEDLNISAGINEFMAQFADFEIGAELLEEINATRNAQSVQVSSLNFKITSSSSGAENISLDSLKELKVSASPDKQVEKLFENVKEFHIFRKMFSWLDVDGYTVLVNGDNGFPVFSARSDKDPKDIEYPINYNQPIERYKPVRPPESVAHEYNSSTLGNKDTATYHAPMVSAGTIGKGRILVMSSDLYGSILVNPRDYSDNGRNNRKNKIKDTPDMENFFHNVFSWLSEAHPTHNYSKDGANPQIKVATNKKYTMFWSLGGWTYATDREPFVIHSNYNVEQVHIDNFADLNPEEHPILILEEFSRYKASSIKSVNFNDDNLTHIMNYVRNGGNILIMDSFEFSDDQITTTTDKILQEAGLYTIKNQKNGVSLLPKSGIVGGVFAYDMCVQDYISLTQLQRKLGLTTYESVPDTKEDLIQAIKDHGGESGWEGRLDELLKERTRTVFKLSDSFDTNYTDSDCLVTIQDENGSDIEIQSQLVKGNGILGDGNAWYQLDNHAKYPVDLNFVEAQSDVSGKMDKLLSHELKTETLTKIDLEREYTNMYALLMNDAVFTGEKFEGLNNLLSLYKDQSVDNSKANSDGEFNPIYNFDTRTFLNYREAPVTRIMLERAFYDQTLLVDTTQFPGKVDAGDTISVDLYLQKISRYSKWYARNMQSTGLFAPAHQEITVTAPSGVDLSKLQLIIGVGDNVSGLIKHELKLKRPPRMVKKYNFNSQTITVKHPYGGLIYVVSNDRNPDSEVGTFTFTNVEKAVYFKLGETDSTAWDTIKNYEAPKAELETEHFILTVARNNLANHSFDEVVQIAREYDEMTINAYDFYGFDRNCSENIDDFNIHTPPTCETRKGYKNREVFDPHISIGAGHSGYPIMIMNWRPNSNKFPQDATNSWLLWHEFGHNTAKKWLNIAGSIEVANNVMALYQQVKFNRPLRTDARMPNVDIIVDNPQSYGSSGAFGRLLMFAQLPLWIEANYLNEFKTANSKYYESNGTAKSEFKFLDESGWDFYKILHREARENNTSSGYRYKSCAENSDLTKVDSLALCSSSILNLDLTEFFDKWEAGTVGIGAVDGVNIYDSSSGFTQNGKNAISDLSLSSPDSDIHYFTGE